MATDATLRIKIGVSVDADASRVFEPIERASARARKRVKENLDAAAKGDGGNPYRESGRQAEKAALDEVRATEKKIRWMKKIHMDLLRDIEKEKKDSAARAAREEANNQAKNTARLRRNQHIADSSALRMSGGSVRDIGRAAGSAVGVAKDVARGAGVNVDFASLVKQNVDLEKQAVDLSNASAVYDKGKLKSKTSSSDILADVTRVSYDTGLDMSSGMEGLQSFNAKTGELDVGRAILADMGKLARATGTDCGKMVGAAGEVSKSLGDMADKGQKAKIINEVLRAAAAQGKMGAVEVSDLAKYMGKLVASAPMIEGKVEDNMKSLTAFAQLAVQGGGATSAPEAASSVAAFVNTLKTPARVKEFKKHGVNVMNKDGQIRNLTDILMDSLGATGGDPMEMKKMFSSVVGEKSTLKLANIYRAGASEIDSKTGKKKGKAGGEAAARAEFAKFADATLSDNEVNDAFKASMNTTEAKVNQFNIEMAKTASTVQAKLLPALEKLAPDAIRLASALGEFATWAADNPMKAAMVVAGGAIAKNVTGEILRATIERSLVGGIAKGIGPAGAANTLIGGGGGPGVPGARRNGLGGLKDDYNNMGAIGTLGAMGTIAMMSVTAMEIGKAVISSMVDEESKADTKAADDAMRMFNLPTELREKAEKKYAEASANGPISPEQDQQIKDEIFAEEKKYYEELKARISKAEINKKHDPERGTVGGLAGRVAEAGWASLAGMFGADTKARNWGQIAKDDADVAALSNMKAAFDRMGADLRGELKVRVMNPAALPGMPPGAVTPANAIP